jgi:hypothetical protein
MINKVNIQGVVALIIITGGLYILAFNQATNDVKIAVVGLMSSVVGYYFGSSRSTAKKDEVIAQQLEK